MCLMLFNPTLNPIPSSYISRAFAINHNGFGAMWAENGKIETIQGMYNESEIHDIFKMLDGKVYAAHFRMATSGRVNKEMTHPFPVLTVKEDDVDLYVMHNGVFSNYEPTDVLSDTAVFAKSMSGVFRNIKTTEPLWEEDSIKELGDHISKSNKVLFMRGDGKVSIINEDAGLYENGVWYSNRYSIADPYRAIYTGIYDMSVFDDLIEEMCN